MSETRRWTRRTLAAQALGTIDAETRAVVPPIHVSTTFIRDPDNAYSSGFAYSRPDNATARQAEAVIATLEGAAGGAMLFASGMAAATTLIQSLDPGAHIVAPTVMYWALRAYLAQETARLGLTVTFVDATDLSSLGAAIRPGVTKLVWIETPANPTWALTDIAGAARLAHAAGAMLAVDSTCSSPFHTRPIEHGADIVMHAATKILNGHSDVLAGVLCFAEDGPTRARCSMLRNRQGAIIGGLEAYLLVRGLKTFPVRADAQAKAAMTLATRLSRDPAVAQVLYPGLPEHPQHALAARQMENGFGFMLSIRVAGGEAAAIATAARVMLWKRATSLGGTESLIEHRASIEGAGSPCPPDLLRLSVGLEDPDDLFADLSAALEAARNP